MALGACFDRLEVPTRTLTVYAPPPRPDLVDRLDRECAVDEVTYRSLPDATTDDAFLVLREDGDFAAAIGLDAVSSFFEPTIGAPWSDALDDVAFRRTIEVFESTVWHALERRQLLAISRLIENRAWRIAGGTLRVGFQGAEPLRAMAPVYARLAGETALDVHVYVADAWDRPEIPGVRIHAEAADEIGSYWFLTFDGDGDQLWTCGLLARECDGGTYEGYWTDDVRLVATFERAVLETTA